MYMYVILYMWSVRQGIKRKEFKHGTQKKQSQSRNRERLLRDC